MRYDSGDYAGKTLALAERTSVFSTTNTSSAGGGLIGGLSVTVVGTGRRVDVEVYLPNCYHSVANSFVAAILSVNGVTTGDKGQLGQTQSTATNQGGPIAFTRTVTLERGVSYTFEVNVYGPAGTSSITMAAFAAGVLRVRAA